MPRGDGTGPMGDGRIGRGLGPCGNPNADFPRRGQGCGRGINRRRRQCINPAERQNAVVQNDKQ